MNDRVSNVLFVCTANSARSILGECLLNRLGAGRFRAHSAGSHPASAVHPLALAVLRQRGLPTTGLRSKSWDEFCEPGAPALDFVFIVCASAADEYTPQWEGDPITAHWCIDDPAAVKGSEALRFTEFARAYSELERRIRAFTSLAIDGMSRPTLQRCVDLIGDMGPAEPLEVDRPAVG